MVVRSGQHVSGDGRVYHPYLAQWAQYWDKSTLFDLVAVLRGVFAKEPPVRLKQQQPRHQAPQLVPPPPPSKQLSMSPVAPIPPPKPPKQGETSRSTPSPQQHRYSQPPPLPPHSAAHLASPQIQQQSPRFSYDASPSWQQQQHRPDLQAPGHLVRTSQPYPNAPLPQQHPRQPIQGYLHPQNVNNPHPVRAPQAPNTPNPPINLLDDSLQVTLPSQSGNHLGIPVPPVPPNPEKDALLRALSHTIVSQIHQTVSSNISALDPLKAQQDALQTAHAKLQAELGELQQLDAALATNEQVLKGAMFEADRAMEDARQRKVPDVDELLVAPTLVGGQLYTLAAEEQGISDAIFVLGRALDKGRVSTEVFVKQTRSLAREQFLKKCLIKKIATGMALDEYQMR